MKRTGKSEKKGRDGDQRVRDFSSKRAIQAAGQRLESGIAAREIREIREEARESDRRRINTFIMYIIVENRSNTAKTRPGEKSPP